MEKEFVPYEQALALKELGFDEPCFGLYENGKLGYSFSTSQGIITPISYRTNSKFVEHILTKEDCTAPTFSQAFRFFRENHDLQCWPEVTGSNRYSCRYDGNDETGKRWVGYLKDYNGQSVLYSKYEEAELECLKKLIEIVKEK
jgi:hypothetical protein